MLQQVIFAAVFVIMSANLVKCEDNCDKHGILLYEEIGCKPVKDEPDDLCPSSYDCSHLQEKGEHCFFRGKKYKNREAIADDAVYESCNGGCFCEAAYGWFSKFKCAVFDCPEFIGGSPLLNLNCMRTYQLGECCSSGQICPPFDNITICKVEDRTFKEGQRFSPKDRCSKCICQKGFDGKYEAPFCKRQSCGMELRHSGDIQDYCAPIYQNEEIRCCPYLWICSSENDIFSPTEKNNTSAKICKFGQKEIKSGQILKRSMVEYGQKLEIKCDCQLPPLLTCIIEKSEWLKD